MAIPTLAPLILPLTRAEVPGWHRVFKAVVGDGRRDDAAWADAGWRTVRGKWHGYQMRLNLADWSDRTTYFLGRYYETEVQLLLRELLRPGDRFVDVGANTGMLTLLAAKLVGPRGCVDAFEPNPDCCRQIRVQLDANAVRHVVVHAAALSDGPGEAPLHIVPDATGFSTLAPIDDAARQAYRTTVSVALRRGDDALRGDERPARLIKIDVEGYECHALRGLRQTLHNHRPAVIAEINPYCLQRAGSSVGELFDLMRGHGYLAWSIAPIASRWSHRVALDPVTRGETVDANDVLWLPVDRPMPTWSKAVTMGDTARAAA